MKRIIASLIILLTAVAGASAQGRTIRFDHPRLTVYLPSKGLAAESGGKALVCLPGGGYTHLATGHEGHDWAPFFNNLGIAFAVLEYEMPKGDRTRPFGSVEAAFKLMADSAAAWGFSPERIGIMGSSAGGHLASTMATHPTEKCRPAYQVLFYPVISMDPAITHMGSHDNLLGKTPGAELEAEYSSEKKVTSATAPAFIALSSDDTVVVPANGVGYYLALQKAGVPASIHVYPAGGHGWGHRPGFANHSEVLAELTAWLASLN